MDKQLTEWEWPVGIDEIMSRIIQFHDLAQDSIIRKDVASARSYLTAIEKLTWMARCALK